MSASPSLQKNRKRGQIEYARPGFPQALMHNLYTRILICGIILVGICIGIPIVMYRIMKMVIQ